MYTAAYAQLTAQAAYERRIAAFGLPAILAPYARPVSVPEQRKAAA